MTEFTETYTAASKSFRAVTTAVLRRLDLHLGQNLVVAALAERDGQTPGELAAALDVTTPTIVKMATRMTAAGLVMRVRDDKDQRLVRLRLTDAGRSLVEPLAASMKEIEERLTTGLTDTERASLTDLMTRVTGNARALLAEWDESGD
ncbi:MarR family winged helix-turn-helix transcriptional regulator [Yinghuangia aomiensis]|uniref:MarR family winged helix-turn-helix transcriptional regulator n=1 Tax=Yinghuangia aomiensis TaxID=676205 RepID=A0ABP9H683_9ACTN